MKKISCKSWLTILSISGNYVYEHELYHAKMVTIKDIAKAVGVSRGTVDRALHNRPGISEETKRRVLVKVKEVGYVPNNLARALSLHHKLTIAIVVPEKNSRNPFWSQIKVGVDAAANEIKRVGVKVLWITTKADPLEQLKIMEELIAKKVSAIAIASVDPHILKDPINKAVDAGIAVVTFNNDTPLSKRICFIGQDSSTAGKVAGELMGQFVEGEGKIAIITGFYKALGHSQRVEGFKEEIERFFPKVEIIGVYENRDRADEAYYITKKLLQDFPDLKGIYVTAGGPFGAAKAIKDMGKVDKVKLICFDFVDETVKYVREGVIQACIVQDPFLQGYEVVQILYDFLIKQCRPEQEYIFTSIDIACRANIEYFLLNRNKALAKPNVMLDKNWQSLS